MSTLRNSYERITKPYPDAFEEVNRLDVKVNGLDVDTSANTTFTEKGKVYIQPFQENATFSSSIGVKREIKDFFKFIKLYGCDVTHQYCVGTIRRLPSTPWWLVDIRDATTGDIVCLFQVYTSPENETITVLPEYNGSGITGHCILDWNVIDVDTSIGNLQSYEKTGFAGGVYISNINPATLESVNPDVSILEIPAIYAVVGHEVNMYFDNVIKATDRSIYDIQMSGAGNMDGFRWYFTPTADTDTSVTIKISNKTSGTLIKSHVIPIIVAAASNEADPVLTGLCIGDSITNYMTHIETCIDNYEHTDNSAGVEFIGTIGTAPVVSEGYSGWRASHFISVASFNGFNNAFWNPTTSSFDFDYYITSTGFTVPDVVFIALGTNDGYGFTPSAFLINLQEMIASIHAYDSAIKIVISLVVPPSLAGDINKDGFAMSNTNWGLYDRYYATFEYNELLISTYGSGDGNTSVIPANINLDRVHNFETVNVVANDRLAAGYTVAGDTTHPLIEGRRQMGDSYYYYLKCTQ